MVGWLIFWILSTPGYQTLDDLWEGQKKNENKNETNQDWPKATENNAPVQFNPLPSL